ncbi:hypothetical protein GCM10010912_63570 [Paenibacillus albidus]|uniref:TIGR03943 family protein n=1 Tax=Paenibacillus albidus TaxID=2041023 RepID=A0A917FWT1_9BACL|nr:TIGR03943 family protein [Paenibacillus albidus]GGG10457.1 hypothetical protein GCM10010912_63570 [Paenibacillus albidus]
MSEARVIRLHYLLRAALLLAFALYIAHLAQQDTLHYYIAPKLARWVRLCPVPLALMALALAVQAFYGKGSALCDCEHRLPRSFVKSTALYSLFLFPLLLGFLLPDQALGSLAADKKGIILSNLGDGHPEASAFDTSDPYQQEFAELARQLYAQPVIPVYPAIFSETFGAIDRYKQQFEGKDIAVTGFLYRDGTHTDPASFAVSRFLVQCCTADATPFGMLVEADTTISLPNDTWVEVRGKLQIADYQGQEVIRIKAVSVTPVSAPSTPYIYTSPDSIAAWHQLLAAQEAAKMAK